MRNLDNIVCVPEGQENTECPITGIKFVRNPEILSDLDQDESQANTASSDSNSRNLQEEPEPEKQYVRFQDGYLEVTRYPANMPLTTFTLVEGTPCMDR